MASLATVGEYRDGNNLGKGYITQQSVDYSGGETNSSAFNADTRVIRVCSDTNCRFVIGADPTATTSSQRLPADVVEYFEVQPGAGWNISIIAEA